MVSFKQKKVWVTVGNLTAHDLILFVQVAREGISGAAERAKSRVCWPGAKSRPGWTTIPLKWLGRRKVTKGTEYIPGVRMALLSESPIWSKSLKPL